MAIAKPDIPPKMFNKCNELYQMLKSGKTYSKEQIAEHFGVSVRTAREMISIVAHYQPIIATSDSRGYRLADKGKDYEDTKHQWAELDSRIAELEARKKPLIWFCEKVEEAVRKQKI